MSVSCEDCINCYAPIGCKSEVATCDADAGCSDYFACVIQCPEGSGFTSCEYGKTGCNGTLDTNSDFTSLVTCVCGGCKSLCPGLCP
jgi:hypothetical protein